MLYHILQVIDEDIQNDHLARNAETRDAATQIENGEEIFRDQAAPVIRDEGKSSGFDAFPRPKVSLSSNHKNSMEAGRSNDATKLEASGEDHDNAAGSSKEQKPEPLKNKKNVRMGDGGPLLSAFHDLESRLSNELRQSRTVIDATTAENNALTARFKIARKYAYPVEHVIEVYDDPHTDVYDVLGVKASISDADLRKAYRAKTLLVHPGRYNFSFPKPHSIVCS